MSLNQIDSRLNLTSLNHNHNSRSNPPPPLFISGKTIGEQNLAFGLKFNAKGTIDCFEKDLQTLPFGQKRDMEFEMVEGDFQLFEGIWSIEQTLQRDKNKPVMHIGKKLRKHSRIHLLRRSKSTLLFVLRKEFQGIGNLRN